MAAAKMKQNLFLKIVSLMVFTTSFEAAQSFRLDSPCRIPWRYVESTSFLVRWTINSADNCDFYNVTIDQGKEKQPLRSYEVVDTNLLIVNNLQPLRNYGAKVECYNGLGERISATRPCRTRTFGAPVTTTTLAPTLPTPLGVCGPGFFTCESNTTECLPSSEWCNTIMDCTDGSDEKNCPGHCTEIKKFHERGNFSCSRWNSPESSCFFSCNKGWVRFGAYYTVCHRQKWTRKTPTCILEAPKLFVKESHSSPTEIAISFPAIIDAVDYQVAALLDEGGNNISDIVISDRVSNGQNETMVIGGLTSSKEYSVSLVAIDEYGVKGLISNPVAARTSSNFTSNKFNNVL